MSSVSGGGLRGRGRGNNHAATNRNTAPRGAHRAPRVRFANAPTRGNGAIRQTRGGNTGRGGIQASSNAPRADGLNTRNTASAGRPKAQGDWQERYQTLRQYREKERKDAIDRGLMADPEKPRALADAITPIGTCQDMCPEYERVVRVVQKDVWDEEADPNHSPYARGEPEPDEHRMVKKFRRSAAGNDEQLPSDLRPPHVLKRTCDYLFHDVIGNAPNLAKVHHFVWDRTRAIRNDFSIQQLTKADDLRIAIECYERIARFHIVSLHLLALPEKPYDKYDAQQEREQLDRTLVSLAQYYDDCRGRFELTNEAEFRAYTIIFQLRDPNPDLEDRVQSWPQAVVQDHRVKKALQIYVAACNTSDLQGPLKPRASSVIARQDWDRFWQIVFSNSVSYLSACVAEIYFTTIRRMVLRAVFRASNRKAKATNSTAGLEWSTNDLWGLFNFDDESELIKFCEQSGFSFREREEDEQLCLDLNSVTGRTLPDPAAGIPVQSKSAMVEAKRYGRAIPAIIDGLNVRQARSAGLVIEDEEDSSMIEHVEKDDELADLSSEMLDDEESLFMPEVKTSSTGLFANAGSNPLLSTKPASTTSVFSNNSGQRTAGPTFDFSQKSSTTPFGTPVNAGEQSPFKFLGGQTAASNKQQSPFSNPFQNITNDASKTSTSQPEDKKAFPSFTATTSGSPFSFLSGAKPATPTTETPSPTVEHNQASNISDIKLNADRGEQAAQSTLLSTNAESTQIPPAFNKPVDKPLFPSTQPFQFLPSTNPTKENTSEQSNSVSGAPGLFTITNANQQPKDSPTSAQPALFTPSPSAFPPAPDSATKALQPSTNPQPAPTPSMNAPASSSANGNTQGAQGLRRQPANDWKPKTPSKLSTSMTVGEEGSPANSAPFTKTLVPAVPTSGDVQVRQNDQHESSAPRAITSIPAEPQIQTPSLDSIVGRLASELTFDPIAGFLKQYVDYSVSQVITQVQEMVYYERLGKEADEFREFSLSRKYGKKWRSICHRNRLVRQGRARRRRVQLRSQQADQGGGSEQASIIEDEPIHAGSKNAVTTAHPRDRREEVDAMFQSTLGGSRLRDIQAKSNNNKRAALSSTQNAHGHKRLKSNDASDTLSITSTQSSRLDDNLQPRSSFLGFSAASNAPNRACTTKTTYFRMKALGINPVADTTVTRNLKRARSETVGVMESKYAELMPPPAKVSSGKAPSTTRPSSSSADIASMKAAADDEALFARIKAARESLFEDANFMRSELENDKNLSASAASHSSGDSLSMANARAEARMRAESIASSERDVPAYRLRQSRFVPKEHYSLAIQRSQEFRASRSRESSRPGSGLGHQSGENHAPPTTTLGDRAVIGRMVPTAQPLRLLSNGVSNPLAAATDAIRPNGRPEARADITDTSTNPYALLADYNSKDEQHVQDDDTYSHEPESDFEQQYVHDGYKHRTNLYHSHNGSDHYDDMEEPTDDMDGDDEEDDEEDEEELETDMEDDDEDEDEAHGLTVNHIFQAPQKMPAFDDAPGNTVEEPIELSD